jgi:hypothetical protein
VKKVWILPLNITVGTVERRGVPVIVTDDLDIGQEQGVPVDRDRIVIGNSFFEPGTFALKDNAIEYKGPLSMTVDNRRVHNPRLSGPGGAPLAPLSKQVVAHKEAVAAVQRRKAEADLAIFRAKETYKQGESPRTDLPPSIYPSEIDLAKALALLKASPTVNQHEFENVSQLVLKQIADEDSLSIWPTRGMWQVTFSPKDWTRRYTGDYDSQGLVLRKFPDPSKGSTKCPLNSNELKRCLQLLNKLGPDSYMTAQSGKLHFCRQLRPTKETEIGGCIVSIDIDGKGSLQAHLDGIVPH